MPRQPGVRVESRKAPSGDARESARSFRRSS
jgi:hypothetical protein